VYFVFAVQNRLFLINDNFKNDLYRYMNGIIVQHGHKLYVVNGMNDHLHMLVSMSPRQAPSDLMYHIKRSSSRWLNEKKLVPGRFSWQEGFGAFSIGKSQVPGLVKYIEEQQEHHKKVSFREEYLEFLKENDIEFDKRYIFKPIE
jgi:putative transposase